MNETIRFLSQKQIIEILQECRLFDVSRHPKDYEAGIAQGKKEIAMKLLSVINNEMPDIAQDFVIKIFRDKFPQGASLA